MAEIGSLQLSPKSKFRVRRPDGTEDVFNQDGTTYKPETGDSTAKTEQTSSQNSRAAGSFATGFAHPEAAIEPSMVKKAVATVISSERPTQERSPLQFSERTLQQAVEHSTVLAGLPGAKKATMDADLSYALPKLGKRVDAAFSFTAAMPPEQATKVSRALTLLDSHEVPTALSAISDKAYSNVWPDQDPMAASATARERVFYTLVQDSLRGTIEDRQTARVLVQRLVSALEAGDLAAKLGGIPTSNKPAKNEFLHLTVADFPEEALGPTVDGILAMIEERRPICDHLLQLATDISKPHQTMDRYLSVHPEEAPAKRTTTSSTARRPGTSVYRR